MTKGLNSKGSKSNVDDMLDNILDDFEEKKGIATKDRPKTANTPIWSASRNDAKNDLDLLDESNDTSLKGNFLKSDSHQRSNEDIQQRKKSLFGVSSV